MSFPTSPTNGQEATLNGITYVYSSANDAWTRKPRQLYTAGANPPANPAAGDQWYDTSEDILYQYTSDGTAYFWLDIRSGIFGGNAGSALGDTTITGNLIPTANVTYNLGSTTNRFKDLWLSGSTIYLGGATISTSGGNVSITNPAGGSFSVSGSSAGNATATFGNVYSSAFYFANGTPFASSSYSNVEVAAYLKNSGGLSSSTDAIILPSGNTAQRPTAANGMVRYNSTINGGSLEAYLGGTWVTIASGNYGVGFVAVAGGGGGAGRIGSGGGAGGVIVANVGAYSVTPSTTYTIVVGAGGTAGPGAGYTGPAPGPSVGGSGSNSSAFGFVAYGGGGGGSTDGYAGLSGGSGGGGGRPSPGGAGGSATQTSQGIAVGYGNPGGAGANGADRSGGGGGAGATGSTGGAGGHGGTGIVNPVPGSTAGQNVGGIYYFAGGGGGTGYGAGAGGNGGNGGGGAGINSPGGTGSSGGNPGTANTGGGGGGGGYNGEPGYAGGAGGSGIVIVYYISNTQRATGGSVTSYSSAGSTYWIHTYTSTGTLSFIA